MTKRMYTRILTVCFLLIWVLPKGPLAQIAPEPAAEEEFKPGVRFNGMGRAFIQEANIDGALIDTLDEVVDELFDGEFVLDVAINATPNKVTEVQGILRLRNELGGFFGAGQSIEVRELWARGIIGNILQYRLGDMDVVKSPYTFFNHDAELPIGDAALFAPQREVIEYENFYTPGNHRRLQGARLGFGLVPTTLVQSIDVDAFVGRIRPTDFFSTPTRFVGGASIDMLSRALRDSSGLRAALTFNAVSTWDDLSVGTASSGIRNHVYSVQYNVQLLKNSRYTLRILGETGISALRFEADSVRVLDEDDTFLELGLSLKPAEGRWGLTAKFVDVGPDFFSIGAQSKRIDFTRSKSYFNRLGTQNLRRDISLFDLSRDRALYTYQLFDRLMPYDPRFGNVLPYGAATPNRRGFWLEGAWQDQKQVLDLQLSLAALREIRGQGTPELRDFRHLRFDGSLDIGQWANWQNRYQFNSGIQWESSTRGGVEVEQVDFQSSILELGLEAEIIPNLHLLSAAYVLSSNGKEILPVIREFNTVRDFQSPFVIDEREALLGVGIRYDFKPDTYLTVQYQQSQISDQLSAATDYQLGQFFALYIMNF